MFITYKNNCEILPIEQTANAVNHKPSSVSGFHFNLTIALHKRYFQSNIAQKYCQTQSKKNNINKC